MARDVDIGKPLHETYDSDNTLVALLDETIDLLSSKDTSKAVSCPRHPIAVTGVSGNTFTAGDAFGLLIEIQVPPSGIIYSATFFDLDNEGTQFDAEIFRQKPAQVASEAAWTLAVVDAPKFVTELAFVAFDDHTATQTSELTNIGKAYTAPAGIFWVQLVCRATPDMASASVNPKIQLQILPDDLNWQER